MSLHLDLLALAEDVAEKAARTIQQLIRKYLQ